MRLQSQLSAAYNVGWEQISFCELCTLTAKVLNIFSSLSVDSDNRDCPHCGDIIALFTRNVLNHPKAQG